MLVERLSRSPREFFLKDSDRDKEDFIIVRSLSKVEVALIKNRLESKIRSALHQESDGVTVGTMALSQQLDFELAKAGIVDWGEEAVQDAGGRFVRFHRDHIGLLPQEIISEIAQEVSGYISKPDQDKLIHATRVIEWLRDNSDGGWDCEVCKSKKLLAARNCKGEYGAAITINVFGDIYNQCPLGTIAENEMTEIIAVVEIAEGGGMGGSRVLASGLVEEPAAFFNFRNVIRGTQSKIEDWRKKNKKKEK